MSQNTLTREQFGRLRSWGDEPVTITLPAIAWHVILVDALGQKLTTVGRDQLNASLLKIVEETAKVAP